MIAHAMPRLSASIRLPLSGRWVSFLYPPETMTVQRALAARRPYREVLPLLIAEREARGRYDAWSSRWDDPIV